MTLKFRQKIILLVALAGAALLGVTGVAVIMGRSSARQVTSLETQYLPLLELDRDLKQLFASIPNALEGAVTAADEPLVRGADALRDQFVAKLTAGARTIADNGEDPVALLADFHRYYDLAREVSVALIAGRSGEDLVRRIEEMHVAQRAFSGRLDASTTPDRGRMASAFDAARAAQKTAISLDMVVAVAAFALMFVLSWRIVRGTVQSLGAISTGVQRFARGELGQPIVVTSRDEFAELAHEANETGVRLRAYRTESEREVWLRTGVAGLATEVAGEQVAMTLLHKALDFLARYTGAAVGAAYTVDEHGNASLQDVYAFANRADAPRIFRPGEGIVGQAVKDNQLRVIANLPADYVSVRSAIGETTPRHLVVVPFGHEGRTLGVIELGFLHDVSEHALELFRRTRDVLGVVSDVADSRIRVQALLEETQRQGEELKEAYDVLEARTRALEAQRTVVVVQNEELRAAKALLEDRATEVARVSGYKSQFLANMSHELRTPLNSILILSRILAEASSPKLTEKQIEFARTIHTSGQELLTLINDVLDLAKIESGREELVLDAVPLADLGAYIRAMFEPVATQKNLALEVRIAEDGPASIVSDRHRLQQVIKNLLSNALKFTASGRVTVTIGTPGPEVSLPASLAAKAAIVFAVADTGIGIPRDKQTLIFEAFAQADGGTSRTYGGTGLGLSIAKQIVLRLGGSLQVQSEVGSGTTFFVVLPIAGPGAAAPMSSGPSAEPDAAAAEPELTDEDRQRLAAGGHSLLVIEDDPSFAGVVVDMVRKDGFVALVAHSASSGFALAERYRPNGIILDVGLPDADGWSVMERLKASRTTRQIPVHFLSAGEGAERARQLGAVGYLQKPVSAEDIRSAIETLQRTGPVPLGSILAVGKDDALRNALEALGLDGDIQVQHVASTEEARSRLRAATYGCLVIDLESADRRLGFELVANVRADAASASLPVIIWTSLEPRAIEIKRLGSDERTRIILKGERATERMLDEARLFLRRVSAGLRESDLRPPDAGAASSSKSIAGRKVLIVDDDMRNVYSLSNALRAEELVTVAATDGQEALERLVEHPDAGMVLMDVMMPRVDGYEATRRIRADARFATLPIIALTAKTMPGDRMKCIEAGANDYIPKPVDMDRLLSLLRVWLGN